MPVSEKQLEAYSRFYKAHFDRVGREGSYEPPPSDISSSRPCTPPGLLTPSREDHGIARYTRIETIREPRPVKLMPLHYTQDPEFRQWLAVLPRLAPDFFPRLGSPDEYIDSNPGIEYDWDSRTLRSKAPKQPYLFALDGGGDAAIAFLGDDSRPASMSPEGTESSLGFSWSVADYKIPLVNQTPPKRPPPLRSKPTGVTKSQAGPRRKKGTKGKGKRRTMIS